MKLGLNWECGEKDAILVDINGGRFGHVRNGNGHGVCSAHISSEGKPHWNIEVNRFVDSVGAVIRNTGGPE